MRPTTLFLALSAFAMNSLAAPTNRGDFHCVKVGKDEYECGGGGIEKRGGVHCIKAGDEIECRGGGIENRGGVHCIKFGDKIECRGGGIEKRDADSTDLLIRGPPVRCVGRGDHVECGGVIN
jgi:hypothetical protein